MSNILTGLNKIDKAAGGTGNANNITEGLMNIEKSLSGSSSEDNITGLLDKISESYSGGSGGNAEITGSFVVENGLLKGQTLTITIPENVSDVTSYVGILNAQYDSDSNQSPFIKLIIKNKDLIKEDQHGSIDVFRELSSANSIVLPDGITEIPDQLFYNDQRLSEVIIPEGVIKIGSSAFYSFGVRAGGFKVILPKSLKRIEASAFQQAKPIITTGIVDMVIPENVQYIGELALEFASPSDGSHYSVIIEAINPPTIESTIFSGDYIDNIYVPAQSVEAYKTAQGWSQYYVDKIAPIPEE